MAANIKSFPSVGCLHWKSKLAGALCVILPLASTWLRAADEATVSMKIDFVAWGDVSSGLSVGSGGKKTAFTALSFRYSEPVTYSGPVILQIHNSGGNSTAIEGEVSAEDKEHEMRPLEPLAKAERTAQQKPKTGLALELEKRRQKDPTLVALAALPPSGCRRATVLLAPAGDDTFNTHVIDDDPSKLPAGQMRIHNLSPIPILMRCNGREKKELTPREAFLVSAQNEQIIYELAYKHGSDWKMQENNVIPVRPTEQVQMMILKSDNSFFQSTDGSAGGYLQIVTLRR